MGNVAEKIEQQQELMPAQESQPIAVASESNSAPILAIIQQVAADPNSDVDKMERLMAMHIGMVERDSIAAYKKAMSLCQSEMPAVVKDSTNTQTSSSYAKFETILMTTQPVYTSHGFAISFGTDISPIPGHIRITAELMHQAGHSKDYFVDLPPDGSGIKGVTNKTGVHAAGSTFAYGKRYLFCMIFNIAVADEDNDGVARQQSQLVYISAAAAVEIGGLAKEVNKTEEECLAYINKQFGVNCDQLANLTDQQGQALIDRLNISLSKMEKKESK